MRGLLLTMLINSKYCYFNSKVTVYCYQLGGLGVLVSGDGNSIYPLNLILVIEINKSHIYILQLSCVFTVTFGSTVTFVVCANMKMATKRQPFRVDLLSC